MIVQSSPASASALSTSTSISSSQTITVQQTGAATEEADREHALLQRLVRWNADVLQRIVPHASDEQLLSLLTKVSHVVQSWNFASEVAMSVVKLLQRQMQQDSLSPVQQFGLVFAALAYPAVSVEAGWKLLQQEGLVDVVCETDEDRDVLRACLLKATTALDSDSASHSPSTGSESDDLVSSLAQSALALTVAQRESQSSSRDANIASRNEQRSPSHSNQNTARDPIEMEIRADIIVPKDNDKTPEEQEIYRLALWNVDLLHRVDDRIPCQDLLNVVTQIGATHQPSHARPLGASIEWSCASQVAVAAYKLLQRYAEPTSDIQKFGLIFAALAYPSVSVEVAWGILTASGISDMLCANPQDVQDLHANIVSTTQAMASTTTLLSEWGVVATLAQAAVAWYTTQHWYTYIKWTERKFCVAKSAAVAAAGDIDGEEWFQTELKWLDDIVLPTLRRLDEQVMLSQVRANRDAWAQQGRSKVREWSLKYQSPVVADLGQSNSNAKAA